MRLLEFEAKAILAGAGITVPREVVAQSAAEAESFAASLGAPVVLKAQVPIGGRMKAGGVLFANSAPEAGQAARALLGMTLRGYAVEKISVQERLSSESEFYLGVTFDPERRRAIMLASRAGGIDVEVATDVLRLLLSLSVPYPLFRARELAAQLLSGLRDASGFLNPLAEAIQKVVRLFADNDALLVEINPLMLVRGPAPHVVAADAHIELDDDALFRQRMLSERFRLTGRGERTRTPLEQRAADIDAADHRGVAGRVVEFDGDLALLIGGGGASLTVFDAVLDAGAKPANYCEIGGNPSVWKTAELTRLLLGKPGVTRLAVIMNVVNNTRADLMARGVIKGIRAAGKDPAEVIAAFRVPGSWEEEAVKILDRYSVRHFGRETSLSEVASLVARG